MNTPLQLKRRFTAWLLLALCAALPLEAPGEPRPDDDAASRRVVAIADIHGDLPSFLAILKKAGLIDPNNRWVAQNTTLVQTGDAIDRGPDSREVLDLLMDLEKQAGKRQSRVIVLLGNHEVMNIHGDMRYVTLPEYKAFVDRDSEKRRMNAWKQLAEWKRARAQALGKPEPVASDQPDAEWLQAHPLGYFEHRDAYGPNGKYGKWLRQRDSVAKINGTIFLHGGLSPNLPSNTIEHINERIREELAAYDRYRDYLSGQRIILPFFDLTEIFEAVQEELQTRNAAVAEKSAKAAAEGRTYEPSQEEKRQVDLLTQFLHYPSWYSVNHEGPLWFRGYAHWSEAEGLDLVEKVLAKYGGATIVVGHSIPRNGRMLVRFNRKVFLIDTGMLSSYFEGGRASALEIVGEKFTALYMDRSTVLRPLATAPVGNSHDDESPIDEPGGGLAQPAKGTPVAPRQEAASPKREWKSPSGEALLFRNEDEVLEFLRTASVISVKDIGSGITKPKKVLLEKGGVRMHAIFRGHNSEKAEAKLKDGTRVSNYRDSYMLEVAAFRLARLLELDAIPPVVVREVAGKKGSVQAWIENAMTETARIEKKIAPPDQRLWNQQVQMMRLFDLLVFNWDRHTDNILLDPQWNLWMVDHTRSFRREDDLPYVEQIILCERTFWNRLQTVDDGAIREQLKDILRGPELEGLFRRRKKMVEFLRGRIASRGEAAVLFSWPASG